MEPTKIDQLISASDELLEQASEELLRAEEDVNAHMVCLNARQALVNYLMAFLHQNKEEPRKPVTIVSLMDQARQLDDRFGLIDLTPIACRHKEDPGDYCMDVDTVSECLRIARQIKAISLDDTPARYWS